MATLDAAVRDVSKKSITKQLRREGKIPSVVYGKTIGNESIAVSEGAVNKALRDEGRNAIITLNIAGRKPYTVMAHELQYNSLKGTIQHIDFLEINMDEEIETVVPVTLTGADIVEVGDVVVNHQQAELTVRALPSNLPQTIEVDVSKLTVGDNIRIGDIVSNANYTIIGDPEDVVVSVSYSGKSSDETEEAAPAEEQPESEQKPEE